MIKIFIHKGNNAFNINNLFQCTIDAFQKLEPTFEFPQNYTEILYNEDTEQSNYIKTEFGLQALSEELRNIFLTFPQKIQDYSLTLTTPIYKKHIETQEIKQFAFLDTIDSQIWEDITEEEITEYLLSIAKKQKIAEVEKLYEDVKNTLIFVLNYDNKTYKYNEYKISTLIALCDQKAIACQNRASLNDTNDLTEFTTNKEFKFRFNGFELPLTQSKLVAVSLYLQENLRKYYNRKKDIISEIKLLTDISEVQNYEISFADLPTEHDFTNIIFS